MFNLSILTKLRIIFSIILMFFIIYIAISNHFSTNHEKELEKLETRIYKIASIHKENLRLIENMHEQLDGAYLSGDEIFFLKAKSLKMRVIENLEKLKNKRNATEIDRQKRVLEEFFQEQKRNIEKPTDSDFDEDIIHKINSNKDKITEIYRKQKRESIQKLNSSFKKAREDTSIQFHILLVLSLLGVVVIIVAYIYMQYTIKRRFDEVYQSLDNLVKDKPDFSKKMKVDKQDEIGKLVEGFNQLQTKLEKNYNRLNILKEKAEDTANLK